MAFETQTKDIIEKRIVTDLAAVNDNAAIEGSFSRDVINANSVEFEVAYAEIQLAIEAAFANTSWGDYLTYRAAEYGVDRKDATKAVVYLVISGAPNAFVIKGSLFATVNNIKFYTVNDATLDLNGTATVKAECGSAGLVGNVEANTITSVPMSITGVRSVTNPLAAYDGYEAESDAELLKRYMNIVRTPATSGNKYHYYNWATSIDGVGACKVLPLWNGAGTVKVIILNDAMATASTDLINKVKDYIETVRPIGATVTVASPAPVKVNVTVKGLVGTADADQFKSDLVAFFSAKNIDLVSISPAQVGKILLTQPTATDYDSILLNGAEAKITFSDDTLATVGSVTFA
jgi:uncharacterized phage protein gp47/JayE